MKHKTNSVIHQPSDKLFKVAMGDLKLAEELIRTHLPIEIVETLDLTTLEAQNNSFIDESYKTKESDVLYQVKLKKSGNAAYVYLIFEHQTAIDQYMAFRLLVYCIHITEEHMKKHPEGTLPLVYPLVVYAGKKQWNAPRDIFPLFGEEETLAREWMFKPYQLWDIQRIPDEVLRENVLSGLMEFVLKHRITKDFKLFLEKLVAWLQDVENEHQNGSLLSRAVLRYVVDGMETTNTDLFIEQFNQAALSQPLREEIMTLAQAFEQKGVEKGIQQGYEQGITLAQAFEQKGVEKGIQQGEATILLRLIERRFGDVPNNYKKIVEEANKDFLLTLGDRILDAQNMEDVFKEKK